MHLVARSLCRICQNFRCKCLPELVVIRCQGGIYISIDWGKMMGILDTYRPEIGAGDFARDDEALEFYNRVNALLNPGMRIIDLGAGHGERFHNNTNFYCAELCKLQGKVERVIGIDVDDAIDEHPYLDEFHVISISDPFPVADQSIDMIVCEWVVEHVEDPDNFAAEIDRVLKPGGWFCGLTPNLYGYVGIGCNIIPEKVKSRLIKRLWPERLDEDVFPTRYKLNSTRRLQQVFPQNSWRHHSYCSNPPPKYHGNNRLAFNSIELYQKLVPNFMNTNLFIYVQKISIEHC